MSRSRVERLIVIPSEDPTTDKIITEYCSITGNRIHSKLSLNVVQKLQQIKMKMPACLQPYYYERLVACTGQGVAKTFGMGSSEYLYVTARGMSNHKTSRKGDNSFIHTIFV